MLLLVVCVMDVVPTTHRWSWRELMVELEGVDNGAGGSSCVSSEKKFICRLFRTLNLQGCGSLACRTELNIIGSIQDMKRTCRYSVHQAISTCYKLHLFSEYTAQQPLPLSVYLNNALSLSLSSSQQRRNSSLPMLVALTTSSACKHVMLYSSPNKLN